MIKKLVIVTKDRVGLIADISYILSKEKINIEEIDVTVFGNKIIITIGVLDTKYKKANSVLEKNNFQVLSQDSFIIKIEDRVGSLNEITRKLANANINILSIYILGKKDNYGYISISVNKSRQAKRILKDIIVNNEF